MKSLLGLLIQTIAVYLAASLLPGIKVSGLFTAFVVAVLLGVVNVFLKPLFLVLTLPINILTLGLFTFVINAILVLIVAWVVPGFSVNGFWWALLFSFVISIVGVILYPLRARAA